MIALPPLLAGALQLTSAWALAPLAVTAVGAPGAASASGVIEFEAADTAPVPFGFEAWTLNV